MSSVEMKEEDSQFGLSRVIEAHKSDVKCVQSTSAGVILSGGRDDVVHFWARSGGEYNDVASFQQEKGMTVNSLAYFEGDGGEWRLFVGRKDGSLTIYGPGSSSETPLNTLKFHEGNIACLYVDSKNQILMSGSWDKTVVVLSLPSLAQPECPAYKLCGHTLSVLAIASIIDSPGYYLSGSADRSIKLWHNDEEVRSFTGHSDVVRSLLVISQDRFLSAANDSTIRLWHLESGVCIGKFTSLMDRYIYSIVSVNDCIVSTGEGGHIEVWKRTDQEGEMGLAHNQIIQSPPLTQWTVCSLPNGDFATGASDGKIYVWTQNEKRRAKKEAVETLDAAVAARVAKEMEDKEKQSTGTVVIKVALDDGAPNLELRYEKGTDPCIAAEKFITDNQLPASYLNEITEYIKANIPEARAAAAAKMKPQETQRVEVDGEKWDYVFDITVDDGRKARLCYNHGEDVDYAAQRFVEKYNLPMKFLGQISTFLRSQMSGVSSTASNGSNGGGTFYDPFTGEGRYVPGGSGGSGFSAADPFTGEGRYVPGDASSTPMETGGDPFTSGGRYVPGSASADLVPKASLPADKKKPRGELVPMREYYIFGVEQLSQKAKDKLKEMNEKQTAYRLNDEQISSLESLMAGRPEELNITDTLVSALDMGLQWHPQYILPIVDLFRIALLHSKLNRIYCDVTTRGPSTHQKLSALLISEPSIAVCAMLCRAIANAFSHDWGREMLMSNLESTATLVAQQVLHANNAVQIAAATSLANWSLLLLTRSEKVAELGPREDLVRTIVKVFEPVSSFGGRNENALIRLLQAVVTLMWGDSSVITLAKTRDIVPIVNRIKDAVVEESGKSLARDIVEMTFAV